MDLGDVMLVLLIDDEEIIRETASDMIEVLEHEVVVADNGMSGIEKFKEHQKDIDFIILDMVMPDMDGKSVYKAIKEIKSDAKIVLSSGYNKSEEMLKDFAQGIDGYIHKPYVIDKMAELFESLNS